MNLPRHTDARPGHDSVGNCHLVGDRLPSERLSNRPMNVGDTRHDHHRRRWPQWAHRAAALGLALAVVGCGGGGGVDSGGTGVTTSYASGAITGFGSVIVRGVRYDDTLATVMDDEGRSRSRDDLRLGMTTEIRGSAITVDGTGASVATAAHIAFGSELLGTVDRVDVPGSRLVVMGQNVDVSPATVFDDSSLSGGLAALAPGDVVEVYAFFDAATVRYRATRIERKGAVTAFKLRGVVSLLDTTARAFNIGNERISYAAFAGDLPANLANGNFVRVRLQTAQVGGVWNVSSLGSGVREPDDGDDVRLEGLISAFTSPTAFSVDGVAVNASGITAPAGLALGARVEVEGTARGGILVADKLKIKSDDESDSQEFQLRGDITSVDAANLRFVLRGVTVVYSVVAPATDFRDGTPADLAIGVQVEARGVLSAGGTQLLATRVVFR